MEIYGPPPSMKTRRVLEVFGLALLLALIAAAVTHGEHEAFVTSLEIGMAATLTLLAAGAMLRLPWTARVAPFVVRCGLAVLLAIPAMFVTSRAVVAIDLWRAKRYLDVQIVPRIEAAYHVHGRYPAGVAVGLDSPPAAPWLIRRFQYASDDGGYEFWVMDPGICGRVVAYSSRTQRWTETYSPCWY